jgi:molybdenum cofactor cytidylyltransferase
MGSPKALLAAPDGVPFVVRIVRAFEEAGVERVIVVTGRDHVAIDHAVRSDARAARVATCVRNPDPSRGQLSSLLTGLDAVDDAHTAAVLMTLVDVPGIEPSVVRRVIDVWQRTGAPIVRPARGDDHGHPVLFDRRLFSELRAAPLEAGAKSVVRAHEREIWNEPVDDDGCLTDVDTPEDYDALTRRAR